VKVGNWKIFVAEIVAVGFWNDLDWAILYDADGQVTQRIDINRVLPNDEYRP
jgi:hypothetical protein